MPSAWNRPNNPMRTKMGTGPLKTPMGISGLMPTQKPAAPLKLGTPGLGSARFNLKTPRMSAGKRGK